LPPIMINSVEVKNGTSFVDQASTYFLARIINALIPFLLLPILTRYLEPSEYGEVALFQVWVALTGAICGLSVHGAAGRKYFDYDEPEKHMGEYIAACLILLVISTTILLLFVAPLSGWLSQLINLPRIWILIGVPFAFCNFLIQLRLGQWQVRKQPKKFGVFQISCSLMNMILSIVFVVALTLGVTGRLSGYTISVVLFGAAAAGLLYRDGLIKMVWRPDLMREAAKFGVPLIPHIIGAFLLLTVDRAVIGARLGLEAAGYYMVAAQLALAMNLILDSINKAYVPWLFERLKRDNPEEKRSIVILTYGYNLFLMASVALAFLVGDELLVFIAGEKFAVSGELVAWLILAQAIRGMYYMVCSYIFYASKTGVIAKITITTGLLNIVLLFVMIDSFGLIGAAWAMCISMLFQWLITWWSASSLVSMPWSLGIAK
jgi:O-antigen/teichoic acid export membrane protein